MHDGKSSGAGRGYRRAGALDLVSVPSRIKNETRPGPVTEIFGSEPAP
jgi:hypothetical protein